MASHSRYSTCNKMIKHENWIDIGYCSEECCKKNNDCLSDMKCINCERLGKCSAFYDTEKDSTLAGNDKKRCSVCNSDDFVKGFARTDYCCSTCLKEHNDCSFVSICLTCIKFENCKITKRVSINQKRGKKLFDKASKIINGERQKQYGNPEDSFKVISEFWSFYLKAQGFLPSDKVLTEKEVAFMMVLFKMVRECYQKKVDNSIDIAGYLGIYFDMLGEDNVGETD